MTSKAEKLRLKRGSSKAGRPRKEGADRFPSGKIRPAWTEKEARSVAVEARARVYDIKDGAELDTAGYTAGRMHMDGKISDDLLKAGNEFAERWVRYQRLNSIPSPSARAQSFGQVRGHDGEEAQDAATRARQATNRMMADQTTLLSCSDGPAVKITVFNLFVMDCPSMREMPPSQLRMLLRGLKALRDAAEAKQKQPTHEIAKEKENA